MAKRDRQLAARKYLETLHETLEEGESLDSGFPPYASVLDAMMSHVPTNDVFSPTTLLYQGMQDVDSLHAFDLEEQDFRAAYGASQRSRNRLEGLCNGIFDMHMTNLCREIPFGPNDFDVSQDLRNCAELSSCIAKQAYGTDISSEDAYRYSVADYLYFMRKPYENRDSVYGDESDSKFFEEIGNSAAEGALLALCEAKGKSVDERENLVSDGLFAKGSMYDVFMQSVDDGHVHQMPDHLSLLDKTALYAVGQGRLKDIIPDYEGDALMRRIDRPELATSERMLISLLSSCEIHMENPDNPDHLHPDFVMYGTGQKGLDREMNDFVDHMVEKISEKKGVPFNPADLHESLDSYVSGVPELADKSKDDLNQLKLLAKVNYYQDVAQVMPTDIYQAAGRAILDVYGIQPEGPNKTGEKQEEAAQPQPKGCRFVLQNAFPTTDGKGYMAQISFANDLPQKDGKYLAGTACTHRSYTDSKGQQKMSFAAYYSKSQIDAIQQVANADGDKPVFRASYFKKGGDVVVNTNTVQRDAVPFDANLHKQHTQEVRTERAATQKLNSPQVDVSASMDTPAAQMAGPELG